MEAENRISRIEPTPVRATPTEQPIVDLGNDRQRQVLERLEEGFEAAATDEGMIRWLRVLSKFHDYSLANTILISVQDPEATMVNGYRKWQEVGRQVQKGSKSIKIFFPIFGKEPDPETGEEVKVVKSYGIGNVFDVRHTEGEPLPEHPVMEALKELQHSDDRAAEVNRRLSWWLLEEGLDLSSEPMHGHTEGYYAPYRHKISIRHTDSVDPLNVQLTKVLAHEAAHYAAGHEKDMDRGLAEVVAECSAFVVMDHFGFDTGQYSFSYSAGWAKGDKDVLKQAMGDIKKVSGILIDAIESTQYELAPVVDQHVAEADVFLYEREIQENHGDYRLFSRSSELHERYATELERERRRMADLEERGVEALSRYDIEIAAGGDADLALRTAKYLVGNHIRYWSEKLEGMDPPAKQQSLFQHDVI